MTRSIDKLSEEELIQRTETYFKRLNEDEEIYELDKNKIKELGLILNSNDIHRIRSLLSNPEAAQNFNYVDLVDLNDSIDTLNNYVKELKEDIEVRMYKENGELFNWPKIRKRYDRIRFKPKFKDFDWKKFKKWIQDPPLELISTTGEKIIYDPFLVRKLNIGLMQMVINNQDLWSFISGSEGAGKSLLTSNLSYYVWSFLHDVGLAKYEYKLEEIMYGSIKQMLDDKETKHKDQHFRIYFVDESEDTDRGNSRKKENKRFKRMMRRSRKSNSIIFQCSPQIGEQDISITLARTNFVFYAKLDYDPTTGLLDQGEVDMYIIPKTKKVFSDRLRKVLGRATIKNRFLELFQNKATYYNDLPKDCVIRTFKVNGVWSFNETEYDKYIAELNEDRNEEEKDTIKLTEKQQYALAKHLPKLGMFVWDMEIDQDSLKEVKTQESVKNYELLKKFRKKLKKMYGFE